MQSEATLSWGISNTSCWLLGLNIVTAHLRTFIALCCLVLCRVVLTCFCVRYCSLALCRVRVVFSYICCVVLCCLLWCLSWVGQSVMLSCVDVVICFVLPCFCPMLCSVLFSVLTCLIFCIDWFVFSCFCSSAVISPEVVNLCLIASTILHAKVQAEGR